MKKPAPTAHTKDRPAPPPPPAAAAPTPGPPITIGPCTIPGETRATRSARAARLSRIARAARQTLSPARPQIPGEAARPVFEIPSLRTHIPHPIYGFRPVNSTTSAGFHSAAFGAIVERNSRLSQDRDLVQYRSLIDPWLSRRAWARKATELTLERGLPPGSDLGHFAEAVKIITAGEEGEYRIRIAKAPEDYVPTKRRERTFDSFWYRNQAGRVMLVLDSRDPQRSRVQIEEMNWIVEYVRAHSWETLIRGEWEVACRLFAVEMRRFISEAEMRGKWYFFLDWVVKVRGRVYAGRFIARMPGL